MLDMQRCERSVYKRSYVEGHGPENMRAGVSLVRLTSPGLKASVTRLAYQEVSSGRRACIL
jgi:hypothetical protein